MEFKCDNIFCNSADGVCQQPDHPCSNKMGILQDKIDRLEKQLKLASDQTYCTMCGMDLDSRKKGE